MDVSAGHRRAALTLHALAVQDREWLLEQLPDQDRLALRDLLAELHELGIPADADVIRSALAEASRHIDSDNAHALAQVLSREAASLRGALLSLLPAQQQNAVLRQWPDTLETRPAALANPDWTPKLRAAVLKSWQDLAAQVSP